MIFVQVPEVLREKLGPEGARALVDLLNEAGGRVREDVLALSDDRFGRRLSEEMGLFRQEMARQLAAVREEFAAVRQEMAEGITAVRQEMTREFSAVRREIADVRVEVASAKSDLSWRLFLFWSGHVFAIAGLLFAFFKFVA